MTRFKDQNGFLLYLSNGNHPIKVDPDEVEKVYRAVSEGQPVRLRQGIINPSFFVCLTVDEARMEKEKDNERRFKDRAEYLSTGGGEYQGMEPLKDIFKNVEIRRVGTKASVALPVPRA